MHKSILLADALVNLLVGCILVLYPTGLGGVIGIPFVNNPFYPVILGAVLIGIGIALLIERTWRSPKLVGLGIGGAVSINLCGSLALLIFLVFGNLQIPLRGHIILWILAAVVFGISLLELFAMTRSSEIKH